MELPASLFTVTCWADVRPTIHPGTTGHAVWRTVMCGELRMRMVEYSAGYVADHWCERGHVLLVLAGELVCKLVDGREFLLTAGMSYHVSDAGDAAHRSRTRSGATLFIVD